MKERPVTLDAEAVRATLNGRKTQVRLPVKADEQTLTILTRYSGWTCHRNSVSTEIDGGTLSVPIQIPFFVGDRMWIRETFWCANETCDHEYCGGCDMGSLLSLGKDYAQLQYVATPECCSPPALTGVETFSACSGEHRHGHWWLSPPDGWDGESDYHGRGMWEFLPTTYTTKHSAIHMPRWASRILLEVTELRVQRLQEITPSDACAEGAAEVLEPGHPLRAECFAKRGAWTGDAKLDVDGPFAGAVDAFATLWDRKHGKRCSWSSNRPVWAYTFKQLT